MTWRARFGALSAGLRVAIVATAIVALGAGVISWSANTWAATQIGIDWWATWMYGVVIDGAIAAGTAAIFELEGWQRTVGWLVLLSALAVSIVDNGAHARPGSWLHTVGATVPALLLAVCLFAVELLARRPEERRADRQTSAGRARPEEGSPDPAPARRERVKLVVSQARAAGRRATGREIAGVVGVSQGHARKLRAQVAADG